MQIQEQRHGAVTVIKPSGPVTGADADALHQRIAEVAKRSLGRLVIDGSQIPFIDSQGLERLLDATEEMGRGGQALKLCGINETVREVLEFTELAQHFEHFDDVNNAVRSFL